MSTTAIPSGFRALSPEETEVVTGGFYPGYGWLTFNGSKYEFIGGGFGSTSATGNPLKFPADFNLEAFQAQMAALAAWLDAGMPFPQIDLGPGIEPSPTAPPIMSGPEPATGGSAPAGSASGGSWDWDANVHLQ